MNVHVLLAAAVCALTALCAVADARRSHLNPSFMASGRAQNLGVPLGARPFGDAPSHGIVTSLPGYGSVKQTQYAGYIGLNDTAGAQLWYWFVAADAPNWQQMPTVAWYQGGPGASSLFGWFQLKIGPYGLTPQLELIDNPHAWTSVANILCIDNPVGVGFSYTQSGGGYRTTEEQIGADMDAFYVAFYARYPFLTGELHLAGESYAGKYIPAFGAAIHRGNAVRQQRGEFQIPLRGLAIGDGWTEPSAQTQAYIPQARALALIDEAQAAQAQTQADLCSAAIAKGDYAGAVTPCNAVINSITADSGGVDVEDVRLWNADDEPPQMPLDKYFALPDVMTALFANHAWGSTAGAVADALNDDLFKPIIAQMPLLMQTYRVFIYNGNFDLLCGALGVEKMYFDLDWSGQAAWRNASRAVWQTPLGADGARVRNSGYVRQLRGYDVTQIIVAGAGHMAPMNQPLAVRDMIGRLVRGVW